MIWQKKEQVAVKVRQVVSEAIFFYFYLWQPGGVNFLYLKLGFFYLTGL